MLFRSDLSKQLSEVIYDPVEKRLGGKNHEGKLVVGEEGVTPEKLSDYIGKEAAQKILETEPNKIGVHRLGGLDLQVGGEGMKGFYDKMLPDYLNNLGKQYGTSVGKIQLETGSEMSRGPSGTDMVPTYTPTLQDFHSFDITQIGRAHV